MPLDTRSDNRLPVAGVDEVSAEELARLGIHAARQRPAHETRKFRPVDKTIPRESRIGFAIGAGVLAVCLVAVLARAIMNRAPAPAGTAAPAIQTPRGN